MFDRDLDPQYATDEVEEMDNPNGTYHDQALRAHLDRDSISTEDES